jgi:hypothetical protein
MANERLFIRCPACLETDYLAKSLGGEWRCSKGSPGERLEAFLERHGECWRTDAPELVLEENLRELETFPGWDRGAMRHKLKPPPLP